MKKTGGACSVLLRFSSAKWLVLMMMAWSAGCGQGGSKQKSSPAAIESTARAGLAAIRARSGSSPPVLTPHIRAAAGTLVPELTATSEAVTARVVLPGQANGQTHVEDAATGTGIDIALVGAKNSVAQVVDGYVVYPKGQASGSIYQRAEPSGVEDYVAFDARPASPSIAYDVALGSKVAGLRLVGNQIEMLDAGGTPRLRVAPPSIVGNAGERADALLAVEGCAVDTNPAGPWGRTVTPPGAKRCRVRVSWAVDAVSYPALLDPRWQTTGSLSVARQDHNLIYLPLTGKVLAVGGRSSPTSTTGLASAELYDKNSRTWSATSSMSGGRWSASATLLGSSSNGTTSQKVLIAGGINGSGSLTTAQLYNQTAGTWAAAGTLNAARHLHTATLLNDGRVLVCGGMNGSTVLTSAALYNPASGSGSWAATTGPIPPPGWRFGTATLIATANQQLNGKVLLAGGNNGTSTISAVFLFDPAQSAFSTLASMPSPREGHQAVVLSDGRILLGGGKNGSSYLASSVIFDPSWGPGNWTAAGNMTSARWGHAMNLLPSGVLHLGLVLVSGGSNGTNTLSSTEYWNGTNWATDGVMVAPVQQHVSVALGNSILIAGGAINNGSTTVSAAEVYDPSIALGCTSGSQCASGFCVSGVCCDSACNGGCGSCNLTGHLGICTPLTGGTVCRALAGICDAAETCDGSSLACPSDAFQPPTTVCRASAGVCDVAETCTGASVTCPQDGFASAATVCRPAAGACDRAENCTGTGSSCPADLKVTDGTTCNDGSACTRSDVCTAGVCVGTAYTCNDGLACTDDSCNGDGTCTHTTAAGNCLIGGVCYAAGAPSPLSQCQQCAPVTSQTAWSAKANGTACNDGNACTQTDVCSAGNCTGSSPVQCTASDQCHDVGTCAPSTGTCNNPAKADGTSCDDGRAESQGDVCTAGVCQGTIPCASIADVHAGATHTCAVRTDGSLWCWGANALGQLGNGTNADSLIPVRAGTGTWNWASVSTGQYHSCGIRRDGTLWCWGSNDKGQLGSGTNDAASTPTQVAGQGWAMVQAGHAHTCGVQTSGRMSCWGDNSHGGLGNGTQANSNVPVEVVGANWVSVAAGNWHTCGIKADQTLWCWGANAEGELGNGTSEDSLTPVQIGAANWSNVLVGVSAGATHTCGIKLDGTLWCWGANAVGQLGIGSTSNSPTPVQVGSTTWANVSGGAAHTCGIQANGSLWCWGGNDSGQVGDGTLVNRLAPVRIPGQAWAGIAAGVGHTCGRRQDGSLWCWGDNADGELGDGSKVLHLAPEQIVGQLCSQVPICGNGQVEQGEECDDGNNTPGDGCSADCLSEKCHGVVCTASDQCHDAGTCDSATGACSNPAKADGVACNDGNACTQTDTCQAGTCTGSNPVACTANDQCHDVGSCDSATGACSNPAKADGVACNDGNACTQTDTCQAGTCTGSSPVVCTASDQCHDAGACDSATGACSDPAKADGVACDDGNACTQSDTCQAGTCTGSNPVACTASDQCHDVGSCDASTGTCSNPVKADGALCNDGNACTRADTCQTGVCVGGNPVACAASDQCHDAGTCDAATGTCSNPAKADGTSCNDGNACTRTDTCQGGTCTGSNSVVCAALDQCHAAGTCDTSTGACSNPNKADGTACNDGNACTKTDTCQAGTCTGGNPVVCTASDQCHSAGTCDVASGTCSNPVKADGTACSDGNACTQTDTCQAGTCTGSNPVVCAASDQCHDVGTCNTATGTCSNPAKANGTSCNDGNACTRTDTCQNGTCTGSNSVTCPAPDQCKLAVACDASSGACAYLPKPDGTACNDGNPCTQTDTCHAGTCVGANPVVCTTDNQCRTDGECDPSGGACLYPGKPDGTSCDDGDITTGADTCQAGVCLGIPANPAPVVANLADTLAFIYSGAGASQIGVASGTIQPNRAAGIRGHIRGRDGSPLAAVKITIANHPEFGYATSREDGGYDMVVNGGGSLVVQLTKSGYLKVNRVVVAPWQGFGQIDDVVMIQPDSQVNPINFTVPNVQVAAGSLVTDQDGTRQASVFIPGGTTAAMVLANGTQTSVGTLNIRITEFTVGADGPAAMPAPLPPATAYTYALSYTADEAIMAGAKRINFNQPVIHYSENFLNLPVGLAVPSGYYDEDSLAWLPSPNGGVVKILSTDNGLAQLDVDGSGNPASLAAKQAMGISDSELANLAQRYQPGQTLWRIPLTHFSIYDFNITGATPRDAANPSGNASNNSTTPNGCTQNGSIIECENQVVGERVPIAGTPFSLNYRSSRVQGYKAENELMLGLSGASVPASLMAVKLKVDVAGRSIDETFAPAANLSYRFLWDGKDSVGRLLNGRQVAQVYIGYQYPVQYTSPPDGDWHSMSSFGQLSTNPLLEVAAGRTDTISWQKLPAKLGTYLAKGAAMGGWTIDVNHTYDSAQVLWRGDGEREMSDVPAESSTVALVSTKYISGPGHWFGVAADGTIYYMFASVYAAADLWKIDPRTGASVHLVSVAGGWEARPVAVAPDSSVYYAAVGTIHHLSAAGQEIGSWLVPGWPGPGGADVDWLAVGPDGVVYFLERVMDMSFPGPSRGYRLMRLDGNGQFAAVAGDLTVTAFAGDGGPASAATFSNPTSLAVGPDGAIYVGEGPRVYRVRRIGTDGIVKTVAGNGTVPGYPYFLYPHAGDGGPAISAQLKPTGLAVGPDNALYITDSRYYSDPDAIRVVKNGIIEHFAGTGVAPTAGSQTEGVPAGQMLLESASDLAVAPDGSLLVVEGSSPSYLMRISPPLPGAQPGSFRLPSQDGKRVYQFDRTGRHLATRDKMTGALQYQFGYNSAGVLTSITDANSLVTTIERDAETGLATAIVAPNGQRTLLTIGADGYLAAVDQPGGIHHGFSYYAGDQDGLLAAYTNPRGNVSSFSYDNVGRLVGETMPGGSAWTLARTGPTPQNPGAGVQVALSSAMGRTQNYSIATASNGTENRSTRSAAGLVSTSAKTPAGVTSTTSPDGMTTSVTESVDPTYWMQAPLPGATVTTTPAGNQMTVTMSRALAVDTNKNVVSQVDTTTVNGKASTSTYNVAANTITNVSAVGRQTVSTLDAQGRVVQVQAGNLAPTAYAYDSRGRLATVTVGSGTSARVTTFGYDSLDRLASVTDPLLRVQSYVYDDANRVVGQVFTDGSQVGFSYDANGNVTSVTPPSRPEHDFGYTPADLMSSYTPPVVAGTGATTYEYNLDKQPTVVHRPDGSTINFTYDSAGRLSTVTYPKGPNVGDGTVTVTRTYNPTTGKLTGVTTTDGQSLAYGYDGKLITSTTWSGNVAGSVGWTYDNNFRVASETVNGANSMSFTYDDDGLSKTVDGLTIVRDPTNGLIASTTLGQVTDSRTYDSFGKLSTYEAKFGTTSLYSVSYVPDSLGRIEQKTETIQGTTTVWNYSYDSAGRLWQVMQNGVLTATYGYDSNGNRNSVATPSGTQTASYDAQDRLLTYGNSTYTYDANGSLQSKTDTTTGQVTTYTYDGQGNLRHVGLPDGRAIDYVIDSENRRVAKKIDGAVVRKWIYEDQLKPVAEFDGSGTLLTRYLDGVTMKSGTSYRVVADHLGTPKLLVNSTTGAVAQRFDVDEWGQLDADSSAGFQVFGLAGGLYDPDTGLVRFGARDYDPLAGRWTAKDPIRFQARDSNLYRYLKDDPVNGRDPTGLDEAAGQNAPDPYDAGAPLPSDKPNDCRSPDCLPQGVAIIPGPACITACVAMWACAGYICIEEGGFGCVHMGFAAYNACLLTCAAEAQARRGTGAK